MGEISAKELNDLTQLNDLMYLASEENRRPYQEAFGVVHGGKVGGLDYGGSHAEAKK